MSLFSYDGQVIDHFYTYDGQEIQVGTSGIPSPNVISSGQAELNLLWAANHTQSVQGSCIDDNGNLYAIYYKRGSIAKYNVNTKTGAVATILFTSEQYGHANGMAYNPNTGYIYIAPMLETGEIYVLDPSDYSLVDTLYALDANGNPIRVWNICYDRLSENFITFVNERIWYRFDDDFEYVSTGTYDSGWLSTVQDIETDGHYIYCASSHVNAGSQVGVIDGVYVFGMDGTYITSVEFADQTNELEGICYDWNTGLFYATYYVGATGANFHFCNMKAYYTPAELEAAADVLNVSTT